MGKGTKRSALLPRLVLLFAAVMLPTARSIWLNLPDKETKCVSEEIHTNVVVLGDYVVIAPDNHTLSPTISVKVTSPFGNIIQHSENMTHGQFAFTTSETGSYQACFTLDKQHHGTGEVSVNIEWRNGIAAKDWDSVAKKEKLEGLELELKKLEGDVEAIHENLGAMMQRESEMRLMNDKTNDRVAWLSVMSLGICILVSGLQIVYLKRFFQNKKLI